MSRRATIQGFPSRLVRLAAAILALAINGSATGPGNGPPKVDRDVPYVAGGSVDQRLDLHVPDAAKGFPTVVFFHGGSLQESGERRSSPVYARVCDPFVFAGLGCATIDYRLAPAHKWPAMPDDAAAAVQWVRTNIGTRGGDPDRIFLFGHSSGCQLVAVLGANPKYLKKVGLTPAAVAGIIAMGCTLAPLEGATSRFSLEELKLRWQRSDELDTFATFDDRLDSDPSRFIGPHMPPLLVVVAHQERFFPAILEQGARLVRRLLEMNRPADVVIVPGKHMTSMENLTAPGDPTFAAILRFISDPAAAGKDSH